MELLDRFFKTETMSLLDMTAVELLSSVPWNAWLTAACVSAATAGWAHYKRVRQRRATRKLDRTLRENEILHRDVYRELSRYAGVDLQDPSLSMLITKPVATGLFAGVFVWSDAIGADLLLNAGIVMFALLGGLFALWHRVNDPPEFHEPTRVPSVAVPRDAIIGFAAAIAFVTTIIVAVIVLF